MNNYSISIANILISGTNSISIHIDFSLEHLFLCELQCKLYNTSCAPSNTVPH
jgi:hypothetical protein